MSFDLMPSGLKRSVNITLVIFTSLSLIACGLRIGDEKKGHQPIKLDGSGFTCISNITQYIEAYIGAELSASQTASFYDCLKRSFAEFQNYTRGSDKDFYRPEELKHFLEKNFLKPRVISYGLLTHAMNLKVALLGGNTERITRDEFKNLSSVLDALKSASQKMQPYMKIINRRVGLSSYPYNERLTRAREAEEVLAQEMQLLGRKLGQWAQPYQLEFAKGFLVEFSRFLYNGRKSTVLKVKRWGELITTFKPMATGGFPKVLEPSEWGDLLQASFGWYLFYLRYKYQNSGGSLLYGQGLEDFVDNIGRGLNLAQMSLNRQPEKIIAYKDLEELVYRMKSLDLMPEKFTAVSVSQSLAPLFDRILGDMEIRPKKRRNNKGLRQYALAQGAAEFYRWSEIQSFLDRKFTPSLKGQTEEMTKDFFGLLDPFVQSENYQIEVQDEIKKQFFVGTALKELDRVRTQIRPFFRQGMGKAVLVFKEELPDHHIYHSFHNLSVMNIMRGLVRLLIRGYAENFSRSLDMVGLTEAEMSDFFQDMRYLGKDLYLLDPRNIESFGSHSFILGNVFTFIGNGVLEPRAAEDPKAHLLLFEEILELLSLTYSGSALKKELSSLSENNCSEGPLDIFGRAKVERVCLREQVIDKLSGFLINMPKMKAFWDGLDRDGKGEVYNRLENIAVRAVQDQNHYKEIVEILKTTTPLKACEEPIFSTFRKEARMKWEACLDNNRRRLPLLNEIIEELHEKGLNPVDCDWVKHKEVSKEYCHWVESEEMGRLAGILHYVEVVMIRYDGNQDGILDDTEVWNAYEVFRGLIDKLARGAGHELNEFNLKGIYAYLIKNEGELPNFWAVLFTKISLSAFELDRLGLIKILSTIIGESHHIATPVKEKGEWEEFLRKKKE